MTPLDVKEYLVRRKAAPLRDIVIHFDSTAATVMPMLELWINKGKVKKHCGRCQHCCSGCAGDGGEFYQWLDDA